MDKIIGLGNALVDVLATLDSDEILTKMDLPKGSMTLIDEDKLLKINEEFSRMKTHLATGGSAGNAIRGMAQLGAGTGFIGKINNDSYGNFFRESLLKHGTEADLLVSDTLPSGVASTFISPDGERTFGTYLGAASTLKAEELSLEMFKGYTYLFIEGYLVQEHDMIAVWKLNRGELFRVGNLALEFERMDGMYCRAWTRTGQLVNLCGYVEALE